MTWMISIHPIQLQADVAQLVEQEFCKLQVVGSNPIISSNFYERKMKIPNINWKIRKGSDWFIETAHQYFAGKRSLVVSLPGAFTPI